MSRVLASMGLLLGVGAVVASLVWFAQDRVPAAGGLSESADDVAWCDIAASPDDPADDGSAGVADGPDRSPAGYAGTATARRPGRARAAVGRAVVAAGTHAAVASNAPYFAADGDLDALAAELARPAHYPDMLRLLHRMGGEPRYGDVTDRHEDGTHRAPTRFQDEPARMAALLDRALASAKRGVVRQALIFHMAIALPPDEARPRLRALAESMDAEDAEDALCALAFSGDEASFARFEDLARTPDPRPGDSPIRRAADADRAFSAGRRDLLRSHRCIETLDRAPYFHIHGLLDVALHRTFPWTEAYEPRPAAIVERALPAWLARYPRHPGSDDMAWRMARDVLEQGRDVEALRWASRGVTEPDGDMRDACRELMVSLVELAPPGAPVAEDVIDPAAPERNEFLLLYMRVRRHARERGYAAALREMADVAARYPGNPLAQAWHGRWSVVAPRGLDSGLAPLPADDPLRWRVPSAGVRGDRPAPDDVYATVHAPYTLVVRLALQFRAWETMAGLESRRASATDRDALDLLYKEGAIHFHERDVLYPAYAAHTGNDSGRPESWRFPESRRDCAADTRWLRSVLSWDLAVERFETLVRLDPRHPLADDAVYSIALAHVKAADDRTVCAEGPAERERHLRAAVAAFERLVAEYPESSHVASAQAALRYWRSARKDLFI